MDTYPSINIEGQILSSEVISKLSQEGMKFQRPEDFNLPEGEKLRDEIQFAYSLARQQWQIFKQKVERLGDDHTGTTETRRFWMLPLLDALGYNPEFSTAEIVNNRSYAISHRDTDRNGFPIHIMGFRDEMDSKRDFGGPRMSPHGLVQEYVNVTEHLYGLVTNGYKLRLIRDSTRLSKLSYVEFDLGAMMEDELYTDFAVMYRLIHASRMPARPGEGAGSIIEYYHQNAIESGARIRERLREKVEQTLRLLGNGFLRQPQNQVLRQMLMEGELDATEYYGRLLKIIYRLLFLMVIEERKLIFPTKHRYGDDVNEELIDEYRDIYHRYYSIQRIRAMAENRHQLDLEAEDLWEQMKRTFLMFGKEFFGKKLGIQALDGELFSILALEPLNECTLKNGTLLQAIDAIARFEDEKGQLTRVNYGALDVEEFGSVYESLLDHEARVQKGNEAEHAEGWEFGFAEGTERKTTGSYYTRPELVQELIKSALVPVIEERLKHAETKDEKVKVLLSLKVCDPAVGSGHFLLAAARKIAEYVSVIRSGEDQPPLQEYRLALREAVKHCVYGVDLNPMAVELCKVALWLESHSTGYPLTFLDHHIRCGNSLVGLDKLQRLDNGIPDGAFKPVLGDNKEIANKLKKRNRDERKAGRQIQLQDTTGTGEQALERFAKRSLEIDAMPDRTVEETQRKEEAYQTFKQDPGYRQALHAANMWAGAFYIQKTDENLQNNLIPTTGKLYSYMANPRGANARFLGMMDAMSSEYNFFHWPLEFPEVAARNGFDVVLGNPPWERIKLQEKEFFSGKDASIANARNKAHRNKLIKELREKNPELFSAFEKAKYGAEALSNFVRESNRYSLTAKGDINTYQLFAGLDRVLIRPRGRAGFIVPTGIATDKTNEDYFSDLVEKKAILSLFDFENREALFEGVHRSYKFCLLTVGGTDYKNREVEAEFAFFLTHPNQLDDDLRRFKLTPEDLERINPNTKTTPVFRTQPDAEITRKIYKNAPVLIKHKYDNKGKKVGEVNPWGVSFLRMFDMSNDSGLFYEEPAANRLPLYEAKYIWHYDHRFATHEKQPDGALETREVTVEEKQDPNYSISPRYWVDEREVWHRLTKVPQKISSAWKDGDVDAMKKYTAWWLYGYQDLHDSAPDYLSELGLNKIEYLPRSDREKKESRGMAKSFQPNENDVELLNEYQLEEGLGKIIRKYSPKWLLGFRDIARSTDVRTCINSITPLNGVGNNLPLIFRSDNEELFLLNANISSLVFDFVVRHKVGGTHLNFFILEQLPVLIPKSYSKQDEGFIWTRVLELVYTSNDLNPFAESLGYEGKPFKWDEERRAILKAELDAYYARLYGLTKEELAYILDPEEVYGEDFPGETFRVLKNKEVRKYGEYRSRRLVMEAWDRLEEGRPMMSEEEEEIPVQTEFVPSTQKDTDMKEFGLHEGIYSIRDAATITQLSYDKVRRWFRELMEAQYEGLTGVEKKDMDRLRISFHGLIELVVIGTLRDNGFTLRNILKARKDLANKTDKIYPFATNNIRDRLKVAGRSIIFELLNGDMVTLDGTGQYNLEVIRQFFRDIEFNTDGVASRILPAKGSKLVIIDPKEGGGKPSIKGKGVWVETIVQAYSGPDTIDVLVEQYGLKEEEVRAALQYTDNNQNWE